MSRDLFNAFSNTANDYVYPALSPCAGAADDKYLQFVKDGIGVVSGNNIMSKIDFSSIKIPLEAYSNETKIIKEGEVVYIPGLTKGLVSREQGFLVPALSSSDEDLDVYFFTVDLSVAYYKNFSYTFSNIEASANYDINVSLIDALNIAFDSLGIKIESGYDASALSFTGTQDGYDFSISNVELFIIDTSENASSSFAHLANADSYDLTEDPDRDVPFAKYPNGAMQGIVMKGIYPSTSGNCSDGEGTPNNYLYINHSKDPLVTFETISVDYDTDVSTGIRVSFDPSTDVGTVPSISVATYNFTIADISVSPVTDVSISITGASIDSSVVSYRDMINCAIRDTSIDNSNLYDSSVGAILVGSYLLLSYGNNTKIKDSSIENFAGINSFMSNVYMYNSSFLNTDVSLSLVVNSSFQASKIQRSTVSYTSLKECVIMDSSLVGGQNNLLDSSVYNSTSSANRFNGSYISSSNISNTRFYDTEINRGTITDSSIIGNSLINNDVSLSFCFLKNAYTNTFRSLVYQDPSTLVNTYEYVMDDDTLFVDTSLSRVSINRSLIWDSSLNNAIIYDSSIYNSYIQDSSLIRCTTFNCTTDDYVHFDTTKDVMIDPSISASYTITNDVSSFYVRKQRRLDVGMSGASSETIMSAGDYLAWVTANDLWNKFGDMYIWTSSIDCPNDPTTGNLVTGFYVYNPHTFDVKIEYMVFV